MCLLSLPSRVSVLGGFLKKSTPEPELVYLALQGKCAHGMRDLRGWMGSACSQGYLWKLCVCCGSVHLGLVFCTHFLPVHGTVEALGFSFWCHWCHNQAGHHMKTCWDWNAFRTQKQGRIKPFSQHLLNSQHWVQLRTGQHQGQGNLLVTVRTTVYSSSSPRLRSSQLRVHIRLYRF